MQFEWFAFGVFWTTISVVLCRTEWQTVSKDVKLLHSLNYPLRMVQISILNSWFRSILTTWFIIILILVRNPPYSTTKTEEKYKFSIARTKMTVIGGTRTILLMLVIVMHHRMCYLGALAMCSITVILAVTSIMAYLLSNGCFLETKSKFTVFHI